VGFATSKVLAYTSDTFHQIMASRSLEKAKAARSEIVSAGTKGSLSIVQLNVTDEKSIEETVAHMNEQLGRLDVLVNNAAVGSMDPNIKTCFQLCLETNMMGPAMVAAAFRPLLFKSPNPYSTFVSSGERTLLRNASQQPPTHASIRTGDTHMVSKAALNMVAVLEARDFGLEGLKVFAMSPGFVRSNLRGTSEEARSGWGRAGNSDVSGEIVLSIVRGGARH
jgi:NAD(P)-dependent dehydrogenase (short-subunit alcohol dehydrogenase family)